MASTDWDLINQNLKEIQLQYELFDETTLKTKQTLDLFDKDKFTYYNQ